MTTAALPTAQTKDRTVEALEPYMTEWIDSLTENESELITRLPVNEAAAIFAIYLADKLTMYSALWKEEWQKRQVAEGTAREIKKDMEVMENNVRLLRACVENGLKREGKLQMETEFLQRTVTNLRWEMDASGHGGLGMKMFGNRQ